MIALRAAREARRRLASPLLWALLGLTVLGAVAAYQVRHPYTVDVGSPGDDAYVRNFHDPLTDTQQGRSFRWSDAYSYLVLPGLGGGVPYSVTLELNPARAGVPLTALVNGEPLLQTTLVNGWHTYTLSVDARHPAALASRDLVVELRVPAGGIQVDRLAVGPLGPGFVAPAYLQLGYLAAIVLLVYLLLGRLRPRARWTPPLSAALGAAALIGALAWVHLPVTAASGTLVAGLIGLHVLLTAARWVRAWLGVEGRIFAGLLVRPGPWMVAALTVVGAVAAYQPRHGYDIAVGSPGDQAYMQNFRDREFDDATGRVFRRGGADSYVVLPGLGGGVPYSVTLTLNPGHPNIPLILNLNGATYLTQSLPNGWQTVTLAVDAAHPQALAAPDLVLEFRPPPTTEILLGRVQVGPGGPGFVVPGLDQLAALAAVVLLVYLLLGRALAGVAPPRRVPLLGAVAAGLLLDVLLVAVHGPLTVATTHLVTTGILGYVLLVVAEPIARRVVPAAPAWAARVAAVLLAGAFVVRYGGMALPETVVIDMVYHLRWLHETLAGNWAALTDPHGGLNRPPRRWQLGLFIPKSPLFYVVAAPLALLPGPLDLVVKAFICLLDASTVFVCYGLLARFAPRLGGWRAGLWAGLAYAANPLGFRALSYGILPTILAQWLSLVFFTGLLAWAARVGRIGDRGSGIRDQGSGIRRREPETGDASPSPHSVSRSAFHVSRFTATFVALWAVLTAALIAFPTVALFDSLILGGLALVWLGPRMRPMGWGVAGLLTAAWAAALLIYYGLYVPDLLRTTLPLLLGSAPPAAAGSAAAQPTVHWTGPLDLLDWTYTNLVSAVPLLTGLAGLAVLGLVAWRTRGGGAPGERLLAPLLLFWLAILPVFVVVNYRLDMIAKHLFFTMAPLALGSGICFWLLARQSRPAQIAAALLAAALTWTALAYWFGALVPTTL